MALTVFNILKNGSGGLDYAGLLQRLVVIKSYRKPADRGDTIAAQE